MPAMMRDIRLAGRDVIPAAGTQRGSRLDSAPRGPYRAAYFAAGRGGRPAAGTMTLPDCGMPEEPVAT